MDPALIEKIAHDLIHFQLPSVSVIISGVDETGAHIYIVNDGDPICRDGVGFAAIGGGARHAESQLMLGRHAWNSPASETLLLAYTAKKRAEVAPGVGTFTDLFVCGPHLGSLVFVHPDFEAKMNAIYRQMVAKEERARRGAQEATKLFLESIAAPSVEGQAPPRSEDRAESIAPPGGS